MKNSHSHIIYFLGIGGIGMSALARYFKRKGCSVFGYDRVSSPLTKNLENEGITIHYEDSPELIPKNIDFVIVTPAIPKDLLELDYLNKLGIKIMKRAEVMGYISRKHKTIAISGSHGKTTTTALLTHVLMTAGKRISAFIGGIAKNINSNVVIGDENDEFVVMEADEFDHSFLQLSPYIGIVTSIDADHLDIYGDKQHLIEGFNRFVNKTSSAGTVIYRENLPIKTDVKSLTYGLKKADVIARNINVVDGFTSFSIVTKEGMDLGTYRMQLYGQHNVLNALAAIIVCMQINIDLKVIKEGLETFQGVRRRFDIRFKNEKVCYIDDYAHHPEEIKASLKTVRELFPERKLTLVFQPHLFSRTHDFMDEFAESLSLADCLILLEIYPAREKPMPGVTSSALLEKVTCPVKSICKKEELLDVIKRLEPELIMTMGAGDIDCLVPQIENLFKS